MLNIRLSRRGKKKQPTYRIIVLEKTKDPWGDFLEDLGFYNPHTKQIGLKKERIQYWLSHGAQASPTVHNLLITHGVIKGPKVKATRTKKKKKKEPAPETPKEAKEVEVKEAEKKEEKKPEPDKKAEEKPKEEEKKEGKEEKPVTEQTEEKKEEKPANAKTQKGAEAQK